MDRQSAGRDADRDDKQIWRRVLAGLRHEQDYGHDRWWPGIMLTVLQGIKRGSNTLTL